MAVIVNHMNAGEKVWIDGTQFCQNHADIAQELGLTKYQPLREYLPAYGYNVLTILSAYKGLGGSYYYGARDQNGEEYVFFGWAVKVEE